MSELRRLPRTDGPWFQQGPLIHGPDHGGFDIGPLLGEVYDEDDARYVVAAINALPDLLAERDRLEAALRGLLHALSEPLSEDEMAGVEAGLNTAWMYWYPPGTIVNFREGTDTGSRIIARIFDAIEASRAALRGSEGTLD